MKVFDHKNIVKLLGVCTKGEPAFAVMELMIHGIYLIVEFFTRVTVTFCATFTDGVYRHIIYHLVPTHQEQFANYRSLIL